MDLFDKVTGKENIPSAQSTIRFWFTESLSLLGSVLRTLFYGYPRTDRLPGSSSDRRRRIINSLLSFGSCCSQSAAPSSRAQLLSAPSAVPTRAIPYVITPERRALLNTIRFAEGTWKGGADVGYRVMFGGGLMSSLIATLTG